VKVSFLVELLLLCLHSLFGCCTTQFLNLFVIVDDTAYADAEDDGDVDELQLLLLFICVQVLLHGCILSEQNVDTVLEGIRRDLEKIETSLAHSMLEVIPGHRDVSINAD